jgi:hypothetical protein
VIVKTLVDRAYDGTGLCGWRTGGGKLDVSDDDEPDEGELTDDEVDGTETDRTDVVEPSVEESTIAPEEDISGLSTEEMIGVTSAVRVGRVLNRLGGAILLSHSVVLFTTEK